MLSIHNHNKSKPNIPILIIIACIVFKYKAFSNLNVNPADENPELTIRTFLWPHPNSVTGKDSWSPEL